MPEVDVEPQRFAFAKVVLGDELEALLTDPWFAAAWWEMFEEGFRETLADQRVDPVTPWEWEGQTIRVPADPPEHPEPITLRRITGSCMARRRVA